MTNKNGSSYEFGAFTLDTKQNLLLRGTEPVKLPAKAYELLLFFVHHPKQVVDKETLMLEVWKDSFVEDGNLAVHISNLRKILNGDVNGKSAIETFPKVGYRFNADVCVVRNDDLTASDKSEGKEKDASLNIESVVDTPSPTTRKSFTTPLRSRFVFMSLLLVILIGSGYVLKQWFGSRSFITPTMTRVPGLEQSSAIAFSPNGEYIAHSATKDGDYTLMMTNIGSGSSVPLMPPDTAGYLGMTFSKDNSFLYFVKPVGPQSLYKIPVLGGNPTKILDGVGPRISFSPDGQSFCFVRESSATESAIVIVNIDGRGERTVTTKKAPEEYSPYEISWSPDGKLIATAAGNSKINPLMQIVSVDVSTGEEKPLSDVKWAAVDGLEWLSDGSGLVAGLAEAGSSPYQVSFIPYPAGEPRRITNDLKNYGSVSVSTDGKTIMAGQFEDQSRLWLGQNDGSAFPKPLITERRHFFNWIRWMGNDKLVFGSDLLGSKDVWITNADGTGERHLTESPANDVMPVASDDGNFIVFASNRQSPDVFNLWRVDANGENLIQLTSGDGENQPSISPDGKWVFYTSGKIDGPKPERAVWKVPIDGGEAVQFVRKPAYGPDLSPDGKFVAVWYMPDKGTPWKVAIFPIDGGPPVKLLDVPNGPPIRWAADGKGVSYIVPSKGTANIWVQPIDGSPPKPVTQFTSERISNFDWSPSGRLVCSRSFRTTEVVLIRNFR